jgi:hypothetical protein
LIDDQLAFKKGDTVLTDVVTVGRMNLGDIGFGEGCGRRQTGEEEFGIRILVISVSPIEGGWNRAGTVNGADKRTSNKFGWGVGGIDRSEEVHVDEVIDEMRAKIEGAAGRQGGSEVGRDGSRWESVNNCRRSGVAAE